MRVINVGNQIFYFHLLNDKTIIITADGYVQKLNLLTINIFQSHIKTKIL